MTKKQVLNFCHPTNSHVNCLNYYISLFQHCILYLHTEYKSVDALQYNVFYLYMNEWSERTCYYLSYLSIHKTVWHVLTWNALNYSIQTVDHVAAVQHYITLSHPVVQCREWILILFIFPY